MNQSGRKVISITSGVNSKPSCLLRDLFVVARRDVTIRVFRLKKKVVEEHKDEELNDVMKFAEEISKNPEFIPKDIFEE